MSISLIHTVLCPWHKQKFCMFFVFKNGVICHNWLKEKILYTISFWGENQGNTKRFISKLNRKCLNSLEFVVLFHFVLQKLCREMEPLKDQLVDREAKLLAIEETKGWFERRLAETEVNYKKQRMQKIFLPLPFCVLFWLTS